MNCPVHKSTPKATNWLLIGPLPPPITGQSMAFEALVRSMPPEAGFAVDFSFRSSGRLRQLLHWMRLLVRCAFLLLFSRRHVYITIAQSPAGFLRDAIVILMATLLRRKTICHLHGGNYDRFYASQGKMFRALIRFTLARADTLVVLSEQLRTMFCFDARLPTKVVVVENGLPYPDEVTTCIPDHAEDAGAPLRLLYLSNLIPSKGYGLLAEAILELKRTQSFSLTCDFCGTFYSLDESGRIWKDPSAEARFLHWIQANGVQNEVRYLGEVSGDEKHKVLCNAQVFVLPTTYVNEGQPISIIEAMAFGNAVIATKYRAISDLVVDGQTGLLTPVGDVTELVTAITYLAKDRQRLSNMRALARVRYLERFTHTRHIHSLHKLMEIAP